jgi:glycosyltransferase involved in cell wall biosynthesis
MKIAWLTPLAQRSAIGRVSAGVVRALLAQKHEVVVIRSERDRNDAEATHFVPTQTVWWQDTSPTDIELQNDAIVLNFGDNYDFHAGTLAFVDKVPCIGIFHDFYLYSLFNRWLAHSGLGENVHQREVDYTYGDHARGLATLAWQNTAPIERIAQEMPMTEWLARRCGAALAHSQFYKWRLDNSCPGPVAIAPLCYDARPVTSLPDRRDGLVTITTVGVINPNKCIDALIKSIVSSPQLREKCCVRLVGPITPAEHTRLEDLCKHTGFDKLSITGEVDEETLIEELDRADILSCLRNPVLEGASASAIEGLKAGRPLIVADAGFYAELPDEIVFKVPAGVDLPRLTVVLETLVNDENLRRNAGAMAKKWALDRFTGAAYVSTLEGLLAEFINAKPLLGVGRRVGEQLASLGIEPGGLPIARISSKMAQLFGAAN